MEKTLYNKFQNPEISGIPSVKATTKDLFKEALRVLLSNMFRKSQTYRQWMNEQILYVITVISRSKRWLGKIIKPLAGKLLICCANKDARQNSKNDQILCLFYLRETGMDGSNDEKKEVLLH